MRIVYWIVDYFYLLRGNLLMFIHKNPPEHYLGFVINKKAPIILIPGISNKWGFLKHLGDKISAKGHPVYIVGKLKFNLFDIRTSAKIVREIIDKNNLEKAVIVGHSKGGLIGKYFLIHENKDEKVKGLIALATPFSGSKLANQIPGKAHKELAPESKVIGELNSHKEVNSKIVSIMPEFDNHIWHKKGSFLQGATNITVEIKGHHKIIFDKNVINKIIELIGKFN